MLVSARIGLSGGSPAGLWATPAQVADAIHWAWYQCQADVVNGSFSYGPSTSIANEIEDGAAHGRGGTLGTVFVFAGGNVSDRAHDSVVSVRFPATLPVTIAVGAINRWGGVSNYSPSGNAPPLYEGAKAAPDLVAPSSHYQGPGATCPATPADSQPDVYTTDYAGEHGECTGDYMPNFSGTSAATPEVAAAAALLLSVEANLTQAQVKSRLLDSADACGAWSDFGAGKLNIARALGVTITPISSLTIFGPSRVKPNTTCMWWPSVSGGTPPFTYDWYRNGAWISSDEYAYIQTGSATFTLRLDVADHYQQTASKSKSVTVSSSAQQCPVVPPRP